MNNKKKYLVLGISCILASIIRDIVEGIIGFQRSGIVNGFNTLNFIEDTLIFMICYLIIYFLLVSVKNRMRKK